MSLRTRVSTFFLAALAIVLLGFSLTLYHLAKAHLRQQLTDRLHAAHGTLLAAVEVGTDGLEWDPKERHLTLGRDSGPDRVRWEIARADGRLLDRSDPALDEAIKSQLAAEDVSLAVVEGAGQEWWLTRRTLTVQGNVTKPAKHRSLAVLVGIDPQPMYATLRRLAWTLTGLAIGVWCLSALLGHWVCRRALAPVTRMATAARAMKATNLEETLPTPGMRDELDDLSGAFNDLLGRVREAYERQRRFTGDASHELRTPLTAMLGQVEVALRRERTSEEYRQTLTTVHGQADHMRRIVEALLFLARADAEGAVDKLELVDLAAWLPAHLKNWDNHERAADILSDIKETTALPVRAQSVLLGELVDNLLDNACKYSAPGTPVTVVLRREDRDVLLEVLDVGAGIAPEELRRVFDPFFRTTEGRRRAPSGVGLGLAVARRIAGAFGARLTAESEPEKGSRFRVRWPAVSSSSTS